MNGDDSSSPFMNQATWPAVLNRWNDSPPPETTARPRVPSIASDFVAKKLTYAPGVSMPNEPDGTPNTVFVSPPLSLTNVTPASDAPTSTCAAAAAPKPTTRARTTPAIERP